MTRRNAFVPSLVVLTIYLASTPIVGSSAEIDQIQLTWSKLAPLIQHKQVGLLMPDGAMIEGQVLDVQPDALVLDIKKSSDVQSYPKGKSSIPRSSVSVVQLKQIRGNWRLLGTVIGATAGGVGAWFVAEGVFHVSGEGLNPSKAPLVIGTVAGLVAGGATIGYFAGRQRDNRVTVIKIIPDSNP
jgi:hypothetical protein